MIRRTSDFVNLENGSNWDNAIKTIKLEKRNLLYLKHDVEKVEKLLSYFDTLITTYPEVLTDEQIRKDSERLMAYCKEKGIAYKDAYSYIHTEKTNEYGVMGATIGLKITNSNYFYGYTNHKNVVDIAFFDYEYSSAVLNKKKLRFELNKDRIVWCHLLDEDSCTSHLYESDTLEVLKPNTYIKK